MSSRRPNPQRSDSDPDPGTRTGRPSGPLRQGEGKRERMGRADNSMHRDPGPPTSGAGSPSRCPGVSLTMKAEQRPAQGVVAVMCTEGSKYYVLDTRNVVGNCALWWRPDGAGYTCNLDDAGLYTEQQVKSMRRTDVPVPQDLAERLAVRHVRLDHLRQNMALPNQDGLFPDEAERARRDEIERRLRGALEFDPLDGDGNCGRRLRDEIVTARATHQCDGGPAMWAYECSGVVAKGERHRIIAEVYEGNVVQHRWCQSCTMAMGDMP